MKTDAKAAAQPFHYFASTGYGWGKGETMDAALKRAHASTPTGTIARMLGSHEALQATSCRVLVPRSTPYEVNWFTPQGVKFDEVSTHLIVRADGSYVTPATPATLARRICRLAMEAEEAGYVMAYWRPEEIGKASLQGLLEAAMGAGWEYLRRELGKEG